MRFFSQQSVLLNMFAQNEKKKKKSEIYRSLLLAQAFYFIYYTIIVPSLEKTKNTFFAQFHVCSSLKSSQSHLLKIKSKFYLRHGKKKKLTLINLIARHHQRKQSTAEI